MNDNDKQPGPDGNGGGNPWMKSLLIWVGILAALALFVTLFDGRGTPARRNAIAYSSFLDKVERGHGRRTSTIAGEVITGHADATATSSRTRAPQRPAAGPAAARHGRRDHRQARGRPVDLA